MKNILFLFTLLLLFGCGADKVKHPAPSANPDAHAGHNHAAGDHAGHDHATDKPNPHIITNPDGTVHVKGDMTAFLVGLWEVDYAIVGAATKVDSRYKGAWIDMKRDFSFTSGIYDQQTNSGTYKYQSEPVRLLNFTFDKEEKLLPSEAKVQGYAIKLVLLGKTPMEGKNSQIKIGQTSAKPSRPE